MEHLAILDAQMLLAIMRTKHPKRIESRFSQRNIPPYEKVSIGDTIYLKYSGGAVVGKARVKDVQYFNDLNNNSINKIAEAYGPALCVDKKSIRQYWNHKRRYGTLIWLEKVKAVHPFNIDKTGRASASAWLCLENGIKSIKAATTQPSCSARPAR